MVVYKQVCMVCGNDNKNKITGTVNGYDECGICGHSLIDFIQVEEEQPMLSPDIEILKYRLQRDSQYIF